MSPLPRRLSAPEESSIVLESIADDTEKAILDGILFLITPVINWIGNAMIAIVEKILVLFI